MTDKRIHIFTGPYGSGKTEVSMNFAVELKEKHEKVALIDLDIVNPYFRSRQAAKPLSEAGVEVIHPPGKLANADLPAISRDITRVLRDDSYVVIFDVGGDDVGATALGRFNPHLRDRQCEMHFVVNTNRPFSKDVESIEEILRKVEKASRLEVDDLVGNINLCNETKVSDIEKGYTVLEEASQELDLPINYLAVEESLKDEIDSDKFGAPVKFIQLYNRPVWMRK